MAETVVLCHALKQLQEGDAFLKQWAAENGLIKRARDALIKEDFNTSDVLCMLDEEDIMDLVEKYNLSMGMKKENKPWGQHIKDPKIAQSYRK